MLPRLAIFGGFDNIVSINLKNWLFDVFCGLCIFAHLRLQTSFFWLWKMAGFCMIYLSRICRFMALKPPKYFSCRIFFCHFAKLSTPKTQLWFGHKRMASLWNPWIEVDTFNQSNDSFLDSNWLQQSSDLKLIGQIFKRS